jgi:predicted metal-dependent hydrolase
MNPLLECVSFGSKRFEYEVRFADRKTLEIAVLPDCHISVTAPQGTCFEDIEQRVRKRLRWINKQVEYFEQFQPKTTPRLFVGGETHLYLGRQYRLKVVPIEPHQGHPSVKLSRGYIWVESLHPDCPDAIFRQVDQWYQYRASIKLAERFELCFAPFERKGYTKPSLVLRKMKTRWGSMSPSGTLLLNRDLIRSPIECIDYVLMHELCHMEYPNHSKNFYRLIDKMLPDWKDRKHRLEIILA